MSMNRIGLIVAGVGLAQLGAATPVIATSAVIDAYFGTATIIDSLGTTVFTKSYLFLRNPISDDFAFGIATQPDVAAFPIVQNNVAALAMLDPNVFVQEINNNFCTPAGPLCDPTHPLPALPADASLTFALDNLIAPPGDTLSTLLDTGDVFKGSFPDYVVTGFASDGSTFIQASIDLRLFEHDFTAVATPGSSVPEPAGWLLAGVGLAAAFVRYHFIPTKQLRKK